MTIENVYSMPEREQSGVFHRHDTPPRLADDDTPLAKVINLPTADQALSDTDAFDQNKRGSKLESTLGCAMLGVATLSTATAAWMVSGFFDQEAALEPTPRKIGTTLLAGAYCLLGTLASKNNK